MHTVCTPGSCCRNAIVHRLHGLLAHVLLETFRIVKSRRPPSLAGWLARPRHMTSSIVTLWPPAPGLADDATTTRPRRSARSLAPGQSAGHQTSTRTCHSRMDDAVAPLLISPSPSAELVFQPPGLAGDRMAPLLQHITQLPATPKSPGRALTSKTHDPWRTVQTCISTLVFFTDYVVRTPTYLHTL
jgi:hypothetical protein